ncbi:MAG: BlaI/MecI/CopY family transcriptional regulator [Acidobacteria bacterium]|nr:BlaI/MecI/CopY family transcriptional regulator [Acidobacteriota bacterium]
MTAPLSRRERQIMDVLYQKGRASAADIQEAIADAPGYSAIRALLRILEEKGHVRHEADGAKYVYLPTGSIEKAKRSAVRHMIDTFFQGNIETAVAALIDGKSKRISSAELDRIAKLIAEAKAARK